MSYILDALRRAEAERERGAVPGLHDQPFNPSSEDDGQRAPARRWLWIAAGVVLLVLAAFAGYALRSDPAPMAVAPPPMMPRPIESAPPQEATAPIRPRRSQTQQPAQVVAQPAPAPRPAYIDAPPPEPKPVPRKLPEAMAAAPAALPASAASGPARPAADARIFTVAELPEAIRRELPKLAMGGAMYSENAASRMVIINGQVLHEGDKLSNDLSLVKINLKAAVFAYKGYRYEVAY